MFTIRVFDVQKRKWIYQVSGLSIRECEKKLHDAGYEETERFLWLR